jgi:hypothetical protein
MQWYAGSPQLARCSVVDGRFQREAVWCGGDRGGVVEEIGGDCSKVWWVALTGERHRRQIPLLAH